VTIDSIGKAETTFRCSEDGPIEFETRRVNQIVATIPGWDLASTPKLNLSVIPLTPVIYTLLFLPIIPLSHMHTKIKQWLSKQYWS